MGFVAIVVIAVLGLWWLSSTQPIIAGDNTPVASSSLADSTTIATTTTTTDASAAPTEIPSKGVRGVNIYNRKSSDVLSIVQSISGGSTFSSLLSSTGVAAQVKGKGPYTIFVPTNGAISQLPAGSISNMSAEQKKRLIQYHVITGRIVDSDAVTAGTVQALSGDLLNINFGTDKIPLVNSAIFVTQYNASNGVVYTIDNVLIPPQKLQ